MKQYEDKHGIELPVCPFCREKMIPRHYTGDFNNFDFWECGCQELVPLYG